MFWRDDASEEEPWVERNVPIEIQPDAARPPTILRVAGELEERGAKILELFKEVRSRDGQVVLPIHLVQDQQELFVEVETRQWDRARIEEAVHKAVVLRGSEHAETRLEILSAYPAPDEVEFLFSDSPVALFQLDLVRVSLDRPGESAELFREVASRRWGVNLDYEVEYLPLVEQLLLAALDGEAGAKPPVLRQLVGGVGCFLGEIIRRNAAPLGSWRPAEEWSEGPVVEVGQFVLDPVGKARAFLHEGSEDSLAFYANYVLRQLRASPERPQA
jgi:hypothetical protein